MKVAIKDLGEIITVNTPSKSIPEFWNSKDIYFIKPDIISDENINYIKNSKEYISNIAEKKARVVYGKAIFVTCIGSIGKIGVIESGKYAFNQQINAIVPNENVNIKYLAYNLLFNKKRLEAIANAPVVPIINKKQFGDFTINIERDKIKQEKITKVLDKISIIIDKRKQELIKLDNLIQSRFVEEFGDLKINPKKWKIKTFDEMTDLITDGEHATPRRTEEGIYLLSARNIMNHTIKLEDVDYIDQAEYDRISKRIHPKEGDVLISCSGTVGRCCSVPAELKFQMVRSVALLRFKNEINPIFAEYMITSDYLKEQIDRSKTQSSQANLFQGKIKKLKGFVPPIDLQNQFAAFVQQVNKSKFVIHKFLYCTTHNTKSIIKPRPNTKESGKIRGGKPHADEF